LRRKAQLLHIRPDLQMVDIRGNVQTRIKKLTDENLDAIILAAAGMHRLGYTKQIGEYLSVEVSIPAIGQGALGIESRIDDDEINALIDFFNHAESDWAVRAERSFLKTLEGGCQVPIACHGTVDGEALTLTGFVADCEGVQCLKKTISGSVHEAEKMGVSLGEDLLILGAGKILNEVYQHETFNVDKEDV
jgi:hydroxymethylbilane synthase